MTVLDSGCSSGVVSVRYSARRYYTAARHYSRSTHPAALTENSASWIQSDPL